MSDSNIYSFSPQEKIKFVEKISAVFMEKVLNIQGALVSDESLISDYRPFGVSLKKVKKINNNKYIATINYARSKDALDTFNKNLMKLSKKERKQIEKTMTMELDRESLFFPEDVVLKTKQVFDVEIDEKILKSPIVEIAFIISKKITPEKRKSLIF